MSDVLEILKRGDNSLEALLRAVLLDSENKVPAERLRIVGALAEGAIIEQGENANGKYVRFANGLQICISKIDLTGIDVAETHTIWDENTYTSPASFLSRYLVFAVGYGRNTVYDINILLSYASTYGRWVIWNTGRSSANAHPGAAIRGTVGSSYNVTVATIRVVAIGKWK